MVRFPSKCNGDFTPEQDDDKTTTRQMLNVEPVHSYDAFHIGPAITGVKGIKGMHRFNICLVVVLFWCENTISVSSRCSVVNHPQKLRKIHAPRLTFFYFPRVAASLPSVWSSPPLSE